jgi:hypothetical protein
MRQIASTGLLGQRLEAMMTAIRTEAYLIAALIAAVASPAFAQSTRKSQTQRGSQATSPYGYAGQKRFTDPDPNVQFELMRQQQWRKGG